jgi:hypothetical protein
VSLEIFLRSPVLCIADGRIAIDVHSDGMQRFRRPLYRPRIVASEWGR